MIYWKRKKEIIAGTTLRNSKKLQYNNMALHCGGDLRAVIENRKVLAKKLDIPMSHWILANQTHSDHIQKVSVADAGKGACSQADAISDCDALYTRDANVLIGVFHADCVAILLYDPMENLICAIHSGWLGTSKQITAKALDILIHKEHCRPENIQAYIAPAIAFQSLEVGMEVVEKIKALPFDTTTYIKYKENGKALIDNKGLNYQMLRNAGIVDENIMDDKNDTFAENESFFSYRRDKNCGRHLSFIVRKG